MRLIMNGLSSRKNNAEMLRKQNALDSKIKTLQVEESALRKNVKGLQGQAQELERIEKQIVDSRNLLDATQKEFSEVQNQLYLLEEKGFNAWERGRHSKICYWSFNRSMRI
jgi:predicted  nucleic acid-binding Zn-ribbon protein